MSWWNRKYSCTFPPHLFSIFPLQRLDPRLTGLLVRAGARMACLVFTQQCFLKFRFMAFPWTKYMVKKGKKVHQSDWTLTDTMRQKKCIGCSSHSLSCEQFIFLFIGKVKKSLSHLFKTQLFFCFPATTLVWMPKCRAAERKLPCQSIMSALCCAPEPIFATQACCKVFP